MSEQTSQNFGVKTLPIVNDIQIVIDAQGKPTAVLLTIAAWERLIEALEDAEDLAIVQQALNDLKATDGDLEQAGYIPWEKARAELRKMRDAEE
jgi:hypothetical protein